VISVKGNTGVDSSVEGSIQNMSEGTAKKMAMHGN
jgi:hypothetical protein